MKLAYASFLCGGDGGTDVLASFSAEGNSAVHGGIRVNASELMKLEAELRGKP